MSATDQRFIVRNIPFWDSVSGTSKPQPVLIPVPAGNRVGEPLREAFRTAKLEAGWNREVPQ